MADLKYYDVILKPIVTEKSMNAMAEKKYTFLVHPDANKAQVKEAVEKMFEGTKVKNVNTMNLDGKTKRRGMKRRYRNFQRPLINRHASYAADARIRTYMQSARDNIFTKEKQYGHQNI